MKNCILRTCVNWDSENVFHVTNCWLDTGVQPNMVARIFLHASFMEEVRNEHSLALCSATNDPIATLRQIELYLGYGDFCAKTISIMVKILSRNVVIGTDFKDKNVTTIYPMERQLKQLRSRQIAILFNRCLGQVSNGHHVGPAKRRAPRQYSNLEKWNKHTVKLRVER